MNTKGYVVILKHTAKWMEDKEGHIFLKCISPKVNVVRRLEFELAYYDDAVKDVNNNMTRLFSWMRMIVMILSGLNFCWVHLG